VITSRQSRRGLGGLAVALPLTLASGLDLMAVAGANTAFDLTGLVDASGGGGLTVGFTPRSGSPVISGIDVRRT
jgi:hypothetical protein